MTFSRPVRKSDGIWKSSSFQGIYKPVLNEYRGGVKNLIRKRGRWKQSNGDERNKNRNQEKGSEFHFRGALQGRPEISSSNSTANSQKTGNPSAFFYEHGNFSERCHEYMQDTERVIVCWMIRFGLFLLLRFWHVIVSG